MIRLSELLLERLGFKPFGNEEGYLISNEFRATDLINPSDLPSANGVYIMFDNNVPIYVGKARDLSGRFGAGHLNGMTDTAWKFGAEVLGYNGLKNTREKTRFVLNKYNEENGTNFSLENWPNNQQINQIRNFLVKNGLQEKLNSLTFRVIITPDSGTAAKEEEELIKKYNPELNTEKPNTTKSTNFGQMTMFDKNQNPAHPNSLDRQFNSFQRNLDREPTRDFRFKSLKEISRLQELAGIKN